MPACLDAIERAQQQLGEAVEVIVVDNASRDRTAAVAIERGAKVVLDERKCLSAIRNAGAAQATGKYLAFIDADSIMSDNMLAEIKRIMDSGRYVGGGVSRVWSDRVSLGILCSVIVFSPVLLWYGVAAVMFYTTPEAFRAIGGFNENLYAAEDLDFGVRLKLLGKTRGQRYKGIWRAWVTTSARKFDEFGDWFLFRRIRMVLRIIRNDRESANEYWYRPRR